MPVRSCWSGSTTSVALGTLRALGDQGPAFFVVPPAVWFPDYEPVLDEITCASLELAEPAEALLLLVVTMGERPPTRRRT